MTNMANADDSNNYQSCIKIPSTIQSSKKMNNEQRLDIEDVLKFNTELLNLADENFGERKWSHSVTQQTIDFVESVLGKYIVGCTTFLRIQLLDGTFHEDIGYCCTEGAPKGTTINYARTLSATNALKKVLMCFGNKLRRDIDKLIAKNDNNLLKVDKQYSVNDDHSKREVQITEKSSTSKAQDSLPCPTNSNCQIGPTSEPQISASVKRKTESKDGVIVNSDSSIKVTCALRKEQPQTVQNLKNQNQAETKEMDEDLVRLERKRKQLEKQIEYKRLMKEKQKVVEKGLQKY